MREDLNEASYCNRRNWPRRNVSDRFADRDGLQGFGTYRRNSSFDLWRLKDVGVLGAPNLELVEYYLIAIGSAYRLLE